MINIKDLENKIRKAADAYYNETPIISDSEFDAIQDKLRELDPNNETLKVIGAPSTSPLQKIKHKIKMGSQKKCNTVDEFRSWAEKTKSIRFVVQEKLDGISVSLQYKGGKLIHAVTRGDGVTGEDITHNVLLMQNVKKTIEKFSGSLRGEILLSKDAFVKLGEESNPRNVAAGLARRKTTTDEVKHLEILYFDCLPDNFLFTTESEKIKFIRDMGVKVVETKNVKIDNAIKWYNYYTKKRESLSHEIDGLVIKINSIEDQESLGVVDNRPKGQIAWKFASRAHVSTLERITWEVGLTGRITPLAHVTPVQVSGVTISKATLHNVSYLKSLFGDADPHVGAKVLVSRRGDVIPAIEEVIQNADGYKKETFPACCPICSAPTEFNGAYLMCSSDECPSKTRGSIKKWINVLGIDDAGDAFIDTLIANGLAEDSADLYTLDYKELAKLPGYAEKSSASVVANINATKEMPLVTFLAALGISGVSQSTAESVVGCGISSLKKLRAAQKEDFLLGDGVGITTATALVEGLISKSWLIDKLLGVGITIVSSSEGKLSGIEICFTGSMSMPRKMLEKLAADAGAVVKKGVSKNLGILVQADVTSTSGKAKKAALYGTRIMSEDEFLELIDFDLDQLGW